MKTQSRFNRWFKISALTLAATGTLVALSSTNALFADAQKEKSAHTGSFSEEDMSQYMPQKITFSLDGPQLFQQLHFKNGISEAMAFEAGALPSLCQSLNLSSASADGVVSDPNIAGVWKANVPEEGDHEYGGMYLQIQKSGQIGVYVGDAYNCQGVHAGVLQGNTLEIDPNNKGLQEFMMEMEESEDWESEDWEEGEEGDE